MSILTINGATEASLGLSVLPSGLGDLWSGPATNRGATSVLGLYGSVPSLVATGQEKRIRVGLALDTSSSSRRTNLDAVFRHLDGRLQLEWSDASGLMQWARLDVVGARERFAGLSFGATADWGDVVLELDLILDAPVLFAKNVATLPVSSTAATIAGLGTLPCAGIFYFSGATTDLTLTYKHGLTRDTITTLTLDGSTGAGTVLIINCARETLYTWDTTTGALVSVLSLYDTTVRGNAFPIFDQGDGDSTNYPTIESNHTGLVRYRGVYE